MHGSGVGQQLSLQRFSFLGCAHHRESSFQKLPPRPCPSVASSAIAACISSRGRGGRELNVGCGADGRQLIYLPLPNKYAQHINKISHLSPSTRTQAGSNSRWHSTEAASADGERPVVSPEDPAVASSLAQTPPHAHLSWVPAEEGPGSSASPGGRQGLTKLFWEVVSACVGWIVTVVTKFVFNSRSRSHNPVSWSH